MSYPSGPSGSSGYPSGPPAAQYNAPTQQFGHVPEAAPAGPSKLPLYLAVAVAVLGLAVYLVSFGPVFTINAPSIPGFGPIGGSVSATPIGITLATAISLLAGLLAGVSLLPRQAKNAAWAAVLAVLALLLVVSQIVGVPSGVSFGWALYLLIALTLLQAVAAAVALLLESGVITAPVPKPKYEQSPYGQYGAPGAYYGQPQGQPQHGGPPHQQGPSQRGGYPQQYGGYPSGPSTGGFPAQTPPTSPQQSGPPTPPTGFPAFGQPQGSNSSQTTQSFESQQPQQQAAPQTTPPPS
ncbi:DUF5336 domain-containing protein [Mycolicibacterium sp. 050158]|uniref:DUF5336 domain-containing protein n=1 Tax=Mycolicibacterium sp. 050158 TaxID=3090602 RepID=UPI00299F0F7D|nr:DUF5336 domain-containing protein [Mycolicibacterium sp. 050158]MDX1890293.1 DUF5336 domain-containing protein [Mycolicibacterium sp. 050158]